jgi:hypothetical protein
MATFNINKSRIGSITQTTCTPADRLRDGMDYPVAGEFSVCEAAEMDEANTHTSFQRMRFTMAAMAGDIVTMRMCLPELPDVDFPDPWGATTLAFAVMAGNLESVEELLNMGADPSFANHGGRTPLDLARHAFPPMPEICALLQQAADSNGGRHG